MTAVIGLLLMLFSVTDGVVTHCDGRQNGTQCYGALGGSVFLQLMDDFSEIHRYYLYKKNTVVLSGRKDQQPDSIMNNRYSFIPSNGTFWINNLSRNDSDEYSLRTFDTNGKQTSIHSLQLSVQAPVSSVSLVSECLSQGEMKVSCSSEGGDSPQYRWTLNGKSLTEAELLSGNKQTNIITLKQHVSGRLVCSVWNHVSSVSNETNICTCGIESFCDSRQDEAQCYGADGGTVFIQLMNDTSQTDVYEWRKGNFIILKGKKYEITANILENRSSFFFNNGTFMIKNLSKSDSGEYRLTVFDSEGQMTETRTTWLTVKVEEDQNCER
ncbi:HEPACAM family member 2 [Oryzias melastigma]|uniref:HEPACAM family member 2 n=1 Tax=Oryzias melastigma TaxID=30732 RepID=UPI00168CD321|nr:HEPACAM family member 2 [Oryzias melastigma]